MTYNLLRGLHILAVIAWMAGLLYLPRLFAYHTRAERGSEMDETFQTMERKLYRIIMNPAMIAAWLFGLDADLGGRQGARLGLSAAAVDGGEADRRGVSALVAPLPRTGAQGHRGGDAAPDPRSSGG